MFSGIVEAVGEIRLVAPAANGIRLTVSAPFAAELALGESVCTSGVCLTVVSSNETSFDTEVSAETLRRSTLGGFTAGTLVNLERSLQLGDRLSGHLVFGHVDGVGSVESVTPEGNSALYRFRAPAEVSRYLVEKGSVGIDGISLTVFSCEQDGFAVAVIPHTAAVTTLGQRRVGDRVNLESDMIGKYVEKFVRERFTA
jgi:riboflavin synthase